MKIVDRFTKYVQIDTQSDPDSNSVPSTEKQKDLGRLLVEELKELGLSDAHLDEYGYVYATIEASSDKDVPTICFCAHMDTSPDAPGANVKPIIHENYQGQDLVLPEDPNVVIRSNEHPELKSKIGHDVITASGTTLLGADNKAGIAAIMNAIQELRKKNIAHGRIRILFTPDEEIGRGVDHVDIKKLDADYAYTIDGEKAGTLENETFSADLAIIEIQGVGTHPGFAKDKMESAVKIASDIIATLPKNTLSPETTEGKEGFIHPVTMEASAEKAKIVTIVRDFEDEKLAEHGKYLKRLVGTVMENYPNSKATVTITEQYRNMKEILDKEPKIVEYAKLAIGRAGLDPILRSIRGGTDGSRLSWMGVPCPNIFAGEHSFHSRQEWCTVQDMEASSRAIIELIRIWEENS